MKNIIHCCLIIPILIHFAISTVISQTLSLNIELDKNEFLEGEYIYLLVTLKNPTSHSIEYSRFDLQSGGLELNIINEKGKVERGIEESVDYGLGGPKKYKLLAGESVQYLCSIARYYYNFKEANVPFPFPIVARMLPGAYRVQAQFEHGKDLFLSNELSFNVISPKGDDAIVFEKLKSKFLPEFIWGKESQIKTFSFFIELNKSHPKSVFLPLIQRTISGFYVLSGDTIESKKILTNIIKSNPNSGYAIEAFKLLRIPIEQKEKLLEEIKSSNPHSRIVRYGESVIKTK